MASTKNFSLFIGDRKIMSCKNTGKNFNYQDDGTDDEIAPQISDEEAMKCIIYGSRIQAQTTPSLTGDTFEISETEQNALNRLAELFGGEEEVSQEPQ